jgi:hypothetical protein
MLNVELTDDVRQYAIKQVTIKNFGNRSAGFNGTREQQYTGIVGECVVYKLLNRDLPSYDSGALIEDIIINDKKVDIKTMARTVDMKDNYVHNFVGYQKDRPFDIILGVSINKTKGVVQICGWLNKKNFLEKALFFEQGTARTRTNGTSFITRAPLYELFNNQLNAINTVEDLKNIK